MEGMWSLILFTLLMQTAAGMVMLQAVFGGEKARTQHCWSLGALALALIGTGFSLLHLSTPDHSVFTINNIFYSWLSREIFCAGLFVALLALYVYTKECVYLCLSALAGFLLVYAMSKIYTMSLVPYWQATCVFGTFLASSLSLGAVTLLGLKLFCSEKTMQERLACSMKGWLPVALGVALASRIGFGVEQAANKLASMNTFALYFSPIFLAFALVFVLLLVRHVLLMQSKDAFQGHLSYGLCTVYAVGMLVFVWAGEILGRIIFYQGYTWFGM